MRTTIRQFAVQNKISNNDSNGFIKSCVAMGLAKHVDSVKSSSGKGKPAKVYELDGKLVDLLNKRFEKQ